MLTYGHLSDTWCDGYPVEVSREQTNIILQFPSNSTTARRHRLWTRQNGICCYCNKYVEWKKSTIEHIVPVSKGGKNNPGNIKMACTNCNHKKGDNRLDVFINSKWFKKQNV